MKLYVLLIALATTSTPVLAVTKIPGTHVSYTFKEDAFTEGNASMIFIDASEDPSGKTYVAFVCDAPYPEFRLYSKVPLAVSAEMDLALSPPLYYRIDGGSIGSVTTWPRADRQTGRLTVTRAYQADSSVMARAFYGAKTKIVLRANQFDGGTLTYTFPVKGFSQAVRAIKGCG